MTGRDCGACGCPMGGRPAHALFCSRTCQVAHLRSNGPTRAARQLGCWIGARVSEPTLERIEAAATRAGLSRPEWLRAAIAAYLPAAEPVRRRGGRPNLGALAAQRWPIEPLLEYCRCTPTGFARRHGIDPTTVGRAARRGLNDQQADHWALLAGTHPSCVWGHAWFDAATCIDQPGGREGAA